MILKLPFKKNFHFREKPVEVIFDLAALEATCNQCKIDFWQIKDYIKKSGYDFSIEILYQAYVRACQTGYNWSSFQMIRYALTKRKPQPKYSRTHAVIWNEYMSNESKRLFTEGMTELFGRIVKAYKTESGKKKESAK